MKRHRATDTYVLAVCSVHLGSAVLIAIPVLIQFSGERTLSQELVVALKASRGPGQGPGH